jgi:ABC-type Fe3+-hydroxamate transport system substrate-binding protein
MTLKGVVKVSLSYSYHKQTALSVIFIIWLCFGNISLASNAANETSLATFDFAIAETLKAINYPPMFLSGLEGYETYVQEDDFFPYSINLGSRHLPNLELLSNQPPKHILISPPAHANLVTKLQVIADVLEYPIYNFSDNKKQSHWKILEDMTRKLGKLVNDPIAAEHYIETVNSHFDNLRNQFNDIDSPVLIVRLLDERHARIYGNGSVEGMVLNRIGLENAWQGDMGQWGMTTASAKLLFNVNATFIFMNSPYEASDGQSRLISNGQWKHLPSIKEGNYAIIPINYWSWGGLPSAQRFADSLASQLL